MALRSRAVLGLGKRLVFATVKQSKVKRRMKGSRAVVEIKSALFNQLRDPATVPMRGFYASALQRLFVHCGLDAEVSVVGEAAGAWRLEVTVNGTRPEEPASAA